MAGAIVSSVVGVVGAGSAGANSDSSTNSGTGPKGEATAPAPAQGDVNLAELIEDLGLKSYSSVFAGAEQLPNGQVRIHTIAGQDAAFRAALPPVTDTADGPSYFFVPATYSFDDLNALTQHIAATADALNAKGIVLGQFGPDFASNTVAIHLIQYSSSAAAYLQSVYGAEVSVVGGSSPMGQLADRFSDVTPWYSGDAIWRSGYSPPPPNCTESFSYTGNNSGNVFTLTAGHCFAAGTTVMTNYGTPTVMGPVTTQYLSNNGPDIDTIAPTSASAREWTVGNTSVPVYDTQQPTVGNTVTVNGSVTGEVRSVTVEMVDQCQPFPDGLRRCNLDEVHKAATTVIQGGDSGGPVYQYVSGEDYVKANGIIIGYNTGDESTGWYQEIGYVLLTVNGTLQSSS